MKGDAIMKKWLLDQAVRAITLLVMLAPLGLLNTLMGMYR